MDKNKLRQSILKDYREYCREVEEHEDDIGDLDYLARLKDFYLYVGVKHDLIMLPGDPERELLHDPERQHHA